MSTEPSEDEVTGIMQMLWSGYNPKADESGVMRERVRSFLSGLLTRRRSGGNENVKVLEGRVAALREALRGIVAAIGKHYESWWTVDVCMARLTAASNIAAEALLDDAEGEATENHSPGLPHSEGRMKQGEYHWRDGWYFRREKDGGVRIRKMMSVDGVVSEDIHEFSVTIPAAEWCSIIAHVSGSGETAAQYCAAQVLHESRPSVRAHG